MQGTGPAVAGLSTASAATICLFYYFIVFWFIPFYLLPFVLLLVSIGLRHSRSCSSYPYEVRVGKVKSFHQAVLKHMGSIFGEVTLLVNLVKTTCYHRIHRD